MIKLYENDAVERNGVWYSIKKDEKSITSDFNTGKLQVKDSYVKAVINSTYVKSVINSPYVKLLLDSSFIQSLISSGQWLKDFIYAETNYAGAKLYIEDYSTYFFL